MGTGLQSAFALSEFFLECFLLSPSQSHLEPGPSQWRRGWVSPPPTPTTWPLRAPRLPPQTPALSSLSPLPLPSDHHRTPPHAPPPPLAAVAGPSVPSGPSDAATHRPRVCAPVDPVSLTVPRSGWQRGGGCGIHLCSHARFHALANPAPLTVRLRGWGSPEKGSRVRFFFGFYSKSSRINRHRSLLLKLYNFHSSRLVLFCALLSSVLFSRRVFLSYNRI